MREPPPKAQAAVLPVALAALVAFVLVGCSAGAPGQQSLTQQSPGPSSVAYPGWPGDSPDIVPIPVSTELVVGSDRFLMRLVDQADNSLASPDRPVTLSFYDLAVDPTTPVLTTSGTYLEIAPGRDGLYRTTATFDQAGAWGVEALTTDGSGQHTGRAVFSVTQTGTTPPIGAPAIPEDTPTASTPDQIKQIATDPSPDPDFYRLSITQAIDAHKPFVIVFATPAFCVSQTCGPALDVVKSVAPPYKDRVNFINVEPYQLQIVNGGLQPVVDENNLPIPVKAVTDYGLPLEPYIFIVDAQGKIAAKFEGVAGADELRAALDAVTGGQPGPSGG
jgi:hypothetical protein